MIWNDYFLWAGLVLLIEVLYHFLKQRTLLDKNSKIFIAIVILGTLHCLAGIGLTRIQMLQSPAYNQIILILAALNYIVNTTVPFETLRFTVTMCDNNEKLEKRITLVGLAVWLLCIVLIIANVQLGFISFAENGFLRTGRFFYVYSAFLMIYYLFNLYFVVKCRNLLHKDEIKALIEVNGITILGLFLQHYLRIQLFAGFSLAIAVLVIYILLKNPHTYTDKETNLFNLNYFRTWFKDKEHWNGTQLVIDFYNLESISYIYAGTSIQKLITYISNELSKQVENLPLFHVLFSRFIIYIPNNEEFSKTIQKIEHWLEQGIYIDGKYVKVPAILAQVQLNYLNDITELRVYTDFLIDHALTVKNRETVYDSAELKSQFAYEMEIKRFLQMAIEQDLFEVWYQPIYSVEQKRYVSLEALSRLKHPEFGWISPELFIQIAIKNGMETQITQLQLVKICHFIKNNEEILKDIYNIKINLSPCELLETGYCEKLLSIIRENNIPFSKIQFEITEVTITQYTQETSHFIKKLQEHGVELCLDDFGSGYANLNTVLNLPYSTVKLDRSLLQGICTSDKKAIFYKDLSIIIKKQGFLIVAEGVETEQEAELLSEWNIDWIQGYYFSKPLPDKDLLHLLKNNGK